MFQGAYNGRVAISWPVKENIVVWEPVQDVVLAWSNVLQHQYEVPPTGYLNKQERGANNNRNLNEQQP